MSECRVAEFNAARPLGSVAEKTAKGIERDTGAADFCGPANILKHFTNTGGQLSPTGLKVFKQVGKTRIHVSTLKAD
ncbi:MAG: hypothetical protein ACTHM6_07955 [Tepidisphaeraceae bacterium]